MPTLTTSLVGAIALQHLLFLVLEMFFWKKELGRRIFRMSKPVAEASATLAANQGLYNGFLAAGLIWSLLAPDPSLALALKRFFLGCIAAAGVFGGLTVSRQVFFVQAVPALFTLLLLAAFPL